MTPICPSLSPTSPREPESDLTLFRRTFSFRASEDEKRKPGRHSEPAIDRTRGGSARRHGARYVVLPAREATSAALILHGPHAARGAIPAGRLAPRRRRRLLHRVPRRDSRKRDATVRRAGRVIRHAASRTPRLSSLEPPSLIASLVTSTSFDSSRPAHHSMSHSLVVAVVEHGWLLFLPLVHNPFGDSCLPPPTPPPHPRRDLRRLLGVSLAFDHLAGPCACPLSIRHVNLSRRVPESTGCYSLYATGHPTRQYSTRTSRR